MTCERVRVAAFGVLLFLFGARLAPAQAVPAPNPRTPDLLGIYAGMPERPARAQLQKHSSTINVKANFQPETGFGMFIPESHEQVSVFLTVEPNDPAVWMVQRTQTFAGDYLMSQKSLLTALREKYGKETMTSERGGAAFFVYWLFDQNGHLLTTADQTLTGCPSDTYMNYVHYGLTSVPNGIERLCFGSFFAVTAMMNRAGEMLQSYTVQLVNLPYAMRAATVTADAQSSAADKARREQNEKSNANKPTF